MCCILARALVTFAERLRNEACSGIFQSGQLDVSHPAKVAASDRERVTTAAFTLTQTNLEPQKEPYEDHCPFNRGFSGITC